MLRLVFSCVVVRAPQQRTEERMHLIPSISIALALAGTAQAAAPASETAAPTRESAEAAVLECHQQYALRYATHVDAEPSEIAAGAFSGCKDRKSTRQNSSH